MDYEQRRRNMVESQIRTNKVTDEAVIAALLEVARERFVPEAYRGVAYIDEDLPIGDGRYLTEPMVFARLLQTAEIAATDRVLLVGTGLGYAAAVLARLAKEVTALDCSRSFVEASRAKAAEDGLENVVVVYGKLEAGVPAAAPYDVIFIDGAVDHVPVALSRQLAEGGRLVTVVKSGPGLGKAVLTKLIGGVISTRNVFDAATPILPGFAREEVFEF